MGRMSTAGAEPLSEALDSKRNRELTVVHEQGVVGPGTDNADLDAVLGVPLRKTVSGGDAP